MPPRSTGMSSLDAQTDFSRARRRQAMASLARRLRREPGDVDLVLPFDEVIAALGQQGTRQLGLQLVPLDTIVGSVDRTRDFDRSFRPTTSKTRKRWERLAEAARRGESFPPISLYRVGPMHFVRDGHHRVSVARALGRDMIDAYVTEVVTRVPADDVLQGGDLLLKSHERLFFERVPLPRELRGRIQITDPWAYSELAEGVEAWGFRAMQGEGEFYDRARTAREWFEHDYDPIVATLREHEMIASAETETEAYMRIVADRYRLLRTHEWSDEVAERLRQGEGRR
jgi:hypothetical protein